jgi:hypothetical protein
MERPVEIIEFLQNLLDAVNLSHCSHDFSDGISGASSLLSIAGMPTSL